MYRAFSVAVLFLFLSAVFVNKAPAADLEEIAVNIMVKAFQVADYDTVETLFGKLSLEGKKFFLEQAGEMILIEVPAGEWKEMPQTFTLLDMAFVVSVSNVSPKETAEGLERWAKQKRVQTQLLGRLTLSLFEQPAVAKAQAAQQLKTTRTKRR